MRPTLPFLLAMAGCANANAISETLSRPVADSIESWTPDLVTPLQSDAEVAAIPEPPVTPVTPTVLGFPPVVRQKHLHAGVDFRGKRAPSLKVESLLNGELPCTQGKVLVIEFWTTWCSPCRGMVPKLNEWQATFGDDIVVLAISDEEPEILRRFMRGNPIDFLVATDTKQSTHRVVQVESFPHLIVISRDGVVRWQGFPFDSEDLFTTETLRQIVETSKADGPPPRAKGARCRERTRLTVGR